jgi:hypothetical protein
MATKKKIDCVHLTNGKTVKPPKKGQLVGEWVTVDRRRTEMVRFLEGGDGRVYKVWFYDEVDRMRLWADGTQEFNRVIEHADDSIDLFGLGPSDAVRGMAQVGATAARVLHNAFHDQQAAKGSK